MNINLSYSVEETQGGTIRYNILNWPYTYQLVYDDSSVIMSLRSLEEARKHATIENERRQDLVMTKLKGD